MRKKGYKRGKYNCTKPPIKLYNRKKLEEFRDDLDKKIIIAIVGKKYNFKHDNHYNFLRDLLVYDNTDLFNILRKVDYYFSKDCDPTKHSRESYTFRYGPIHGPKKYEEYKQLQSNLLRGSYESGIRKKTNYFTGFSVDYYISIGYTNEEANIKVSENRKKQQEGTALAISTNPDTSPLRIGYYINKGMSEDEAKEALRIRQTTFSLEICIEKYGEEEGKKVWQERQDKWQDTLTSKSPEEILRINKLKVEGSLSSTTTGRSKKEEDFISKLEFFYGIEIERNIILEENNLIRTFDGRYKNILIEFQGKYWHCDPREYKSDFFHTIKKKTAQEIWDYDLEKKTLFESIGYEIFCVWEKDYDNKEELAKIFQEFGKYV